jgi:hypothetical protein
LALPELLAAPDATRGGFVWPNQYLLGYFQRMTVIFSG